MFMAPKVAWIVTHRHLRGVDSEGLSMRAIALIICLSSCDLLGPAPSLSHAAATSGCGPAGGPTIVILLSHDPIRSVPPSFPYVSVTIWQPVTTASLPDTPGASTALAQPPPSISRGPADRSRGRAAASR